jgi:hypothetical protein
LQDVYLTFPSPTNFMNADSANREAAQSFLPVQLH